jgi:hypothetical protein
MASRPHRSGIPSNDEVSAGPSSFNSSGFIPPSGGWIGPGQTSEFNRPSFEPLSASRSVWSLMPNSCSHYPIADLHSNGPTLLGDFPAVAPEYMTVSLDHERRDEGYVAPCLNPLHSGPPTSIHGGTFITAGNVNFCGKKRRRDETIDGRSFLFRRRPAFCLPDLTFQMVC